jgi:steroid 5-alpha reductase family enzyme
VEEHKADQEEDVSEQAGDKSEEGRGESNVQALGAIVIALVVGGLVAWAGSTGGDRWQGLPVFAICAFLAFAVNWLVFVPSAIARTEKFYDLTGGLTYLTVTLVAVSLSRELDVRAAIAAAGVVIWASRLATFLFMRISKEGKDSRFDEIKTNRLSFLMAWTLQGLWVLLTAGAALAVITGGTRGSLGIVGILGILVWIAGFAIEAVADAQKSKFREDPSNKGRFIDTGLWAWSRHPNYFGEIVIWTGMAILAAPALAGAQYVTLISPVFVAFLLIKVSGIPMLEQRADERWGGQSDYERYKANTPVLIPRPPRGT